MKRVLFTLEPAALCEWRVEVPAKVLAAVLPDMYGDYILVEDYPFMGLLVWRAFVGEVCLK